MGTTERLGEGLPSFVAVYAALTLIWWHVGTLDEQK